MTGRDVFQGRPDDAEQIETVVPIKFRVFDCDDSIDQIARQAVVRNCLPVLHVDLSKYLVVSIEDYTGGFHLLQFAEIEPGGLAFEIGGQNRKVNDASADEHRNNGGRDIELRPGIPRAPET